MSGVMVELSTPSECLIMDVYLDGLVWRHVLIRHD